MPKTTTITKGWPPSRRRAQAARIRRTKPWLKTTGPRTAAGKARSSRNAYKHGFRSPAADGIRALLRWNRRVVKNVLAGLPAPPLPPMRVRSGNNFLKLFGFHNINRVAKIHNLRKKIPCPKNPNP